jgi:hypothetical protein
MGVSIGLIKIVDELAYFEALFGKTETKPADMGFVFY